MFALTKKSTEALVLFTDVIMLRYATCTIKLIIMKINFVFDILFDTDHQLGFFFQQDSYLFWETLLYNKRVNDVVSDARLTTDVFKQILFKK